MSHVRPDELVELSSKYQLWLKPICRLNITVQLPQLSSGKAAISTTAVIEKINKRAKVQFKSLKVTKITIDFLRLEGELESLKQLDIVQQRLDRVKIKLDGFDEQLKLKTNKLKIGPFKHDWETFFRDNPHMDELKAGYRPDTVLIQNLPLRWFSKDENLKTNWLIGAFSTFGDIRRFHIPLLDEIEKAKASKSDESEGFKKFNFNSEHQTFDVYLMYKDYVGFVNAMDGLRGMKLVKCRKDADFKTEYTEHEIKIDFDKSKHLSDKAIRRRQIAKKYGINTLDDLNEYKKKAKERKALYEQRMKQLKRHKKRSRNLLDFLARLVAVEVKKREQEELQALNERLLKERLLEEEKKLRNKLIERQRTLMMEKLKGKLPADDAKESNGSAENHQHSHASYDRTDYEHREYSEHHREYSDQREYGENREYSNNREHFDHRDHPDRLPRPDHRSVPNRYDDRKSDYPFKNPRNANQHFNPNFGPPGKQTNHFNSGQLNPPHYQPYRTARGPNVRHYQPYQANNQTTFAYSKKSNYYDPEQFEHAERFPTRHDRSAERFVDRPAGHRFDGYPERAYPADKSDRERSGSYQDRPGNYQARGNYPDGYPERGYPERGHPERGYPDRSGYPGRDGYSDRSYPERGLHQDRGNYPDRLKHSDRGGYPDRPDYRDRAQNYEKPYERSFNKPYRAREEEEDSRSDEKSSSRPKSMVVLPQK